MKKNLKEIENKAAQDSAEGDAIDGTAAAKEGSSVHITRELRSTEPLYHSDNAAVHAHFYPRTRSRHF